MDAILLLRMLPQVINVISEASKLIPAAGAVPKYLDILALLVGKGAVAYAELIELKDLVVTMVQQNREPTDDEWITMVARSDSAHARIQAYDFAAEEPDGEAATL